MDQSEGESGRMISAPTGPSRREAARREQAKRDHENTLTEKGGAAGPAVSHEKR